MVAPAGPTAPPTTYVTAGPEPARTEPGLAGDPNIDRAWLSPTAATQPRGTFEVNDWEIVLLGITYGITDNFQLTAAFVPPLVKDQPFIGLASAKVAAIPEGRVRLAFSGAIGGGGNGDDARGVGTLGGVVSFCTDDPCASLASGFVYFGFALGSSQNEVPVAFGGSLIQRLSDSVKLVIEVNSGGWFGGNDSGIAQAALVNYGVRFYGKSMAGDIGFIRPFIFYKDVNDPFVLGYPMVTFSYRWGG
jgi:hypothetical protein